MTFIGILPLELKKHFIFRIGLAIAKRLAEDGASVMISSRKQANVEEALIDLRKNLPQSARQVAPQDK